MFLVVKSSDKTIAHKKATRPKHRPTKKATSDKRKVDPDSISKEGLSRAKVLEESKDRNRGTIAEIKTTTRPEDEVVTYDEVDFELREIAQRGKQVLVGPDSLTRFERARITGARSLQLSLGAPTLINVPADVKDSVSLATLELDAKALPISIRRVLPNGLYQDMPIEWLK